jgi:hypothetical protein
MPPDHRRDAAPASATGTDIRNTTAHDNGYTDVTSIEWPRPASEIREELVAIAVAAYEAGGGVDPVVLERYAHELYDCCGLIVILGGDPAATERLARACDETAELARILRSKAVA